MTAFILKAAIISLSGVLAPGPITAATLASGPRNRHAGLFVGLGHVTVELPLIILLIGGAGALIQIKGVRLGIGLVGGIFLIIMGAQLLKDFRKLNSGPQASSSRHPFWTGIVLTGANPYFLIWWATVGLALATQAADLGLSALALFALIHWMCDIGWLEILSLAGYKGTQVMGARSQQIISLVCGLALLFFGLKFVYDVGLGLAALASL